MVMAANPLGRMSDQFEPTAPLARSKVSRMGVVGASDEGAGTVAVALVEGGVWLAGEVEAEVAVTVAVGLVVAAVVPAVLVAVTRAVMVEPTSVLVSV